MGRHGWLPAAALAAVAATALAVCLWAFYLRGRDEAAIAAIILVLVLAQLALFVSRDRRRALDIDELFLLVGDDGPLAGRIAEMEQRLEEEAADSPPQPPSGKERLLAEVKELRSSLHELSSRAATPVRPPPVAALREPPASRAPALAEERLDLYLEPLVSLNTQATVHYRASLGIETAPGRRMEHDELYAEAERTDLRAALDVFALQRAMPVARRLMAKRPEARIFLPIGAATLIKPGYIAEIERLVGNSRPAAQGLVFEIGHGVLAGLDSAGIEGLARLARQGPLLCLANADAQGLDLGALRGLRFRYLSFAAATFPAEGLRLTRLAAVQGFEILSADVATTDELDHVGRWATLARGPAVAAPRLVKSEPAAIQPARAA